MQSLLDSIERDIKDHNSKAQSFLAIAYAVLIAAVVFALLYVVPGIAARALPEMEKELIASQQIHRLSEEQFMAKYKKKPYDVTKKEFESSISAGTVTDELRDAYALTLVPSDTLVKFFRLLRTLQVEDRKMEYLGTIIPIVLGGVLAGFLLTYRFHAQAAKEFSLKKFELLQSNLLAHKKGND